MVRVFGIGLRDGLSAYIIETAAGATPTLEDSSFLITFLEADDTDITDKMHSVEYIKSDEGEAIRFFTPSMQERITVRVKGLIGTDSVTIFTVDTQGNVNTDDGSDTFQTV